MAEVCAADEKLLHPTQSRALCPCQSKHSTKQAPVRQHPHSLWCPAHSCLFQFNQPPPAWVSPCRGGQAVSRGPAVICTSSSRRCQRRGCFGKQKQTQHLPPLCLGRWTDINPSSHALPARAVLGFAHKPRAAPLQAQLQLPDYVSSNGHTCPPEMFWASLPHLWPGHKT